jgi:glycosyltransferase involved in cell wall biosynthesis
MKTLNRLAIITTHPIQYNAPLFELLSQRNTVIIKVFYTWGKSVLEDKYDPGFGKVIQWDIPLLKGYDYEFLENIAKDKGSHHFKGIDNPHIIEVIEKFKPNAILVYGWSFKSHLKVLRYFKNKIPVLFRGDSTLLDESGYLSSIKRNLFLRWVYRHIDVALYVGKHNYDYYIKAGLKKAKLILAPHAIDNLRFTNSTNFDENGKEGFRHQLNIPSADFVFLFAGKLESQKAPGLLLSAFTKSDFNKSVHLVLVGNGVLEKRLKVDYQYHENIHFMDFQNQVQMPSVYEMADVYVLPSNSETWGLSVNEAMANGKAIIVSNKCGCAIDLVEEGKNGFVFKAGDTEDLAKCLTKIYLFKNNLENFEEKSLQIIENFSLGRVAEQIERTVNNI